MTEKRFDIGMLKNYVNDNKTNYCYVLELQTDAKHLCNLLNQLNNENMQLKSENQRLKEREQEIKNKIEKLEKLKV